MNSRKAWALGLAALCSAASLAATPAAMAGETTAAATCTHPSWSNKDSDTGKSNSSSWVPIRTGPNSGCSLVINVSSLNVLDYDCYTRNSAGNTWTHVHTTDPPLSSGWIYDGSLNDGGSYKLC